MMAILPPALLLCLAAQEVDFTLRLEFRDGAWVFRVEGRTDLPPEAELRARVYAVTLVDDFGKGKREDEEPLVYDDDRIRTAFRRIVVKDGTFAADVTRFRREPWALRYRARIHYRPAGGSDEEVSFAADLRHGDDEQFTLQMKARVEEAVRDLVTVLELHREFRKRFEEHRKRFRGGAWKSWKDDWFERVERLRERNEERYNLWCVWMERQVRLGVDSSCHLLRRMLMDGGEYFTDAALTDEERAARLKRIEDIFGDFHDYWEGVVERVGVGHRVPIDPDRVGPILRAVDGACEPLRGWVKSGEGDLREIRVRMRREGLAAILRLPAILRIRKSVYRLVEALALRFRRLLDAAEAESGIKEALRAYDEAMGELRRFAGPGGN